MLNNGRVWKRHLDHIKSDSMDNAVAERDSERVPQEAAPDPVPQATLSPGDPSPPPIPLSMPILNSVKPGTQVGLEKVNNPTPDVETPSFLGTSLSEATIMDKSLGTLLRFWGVFQFTQVQLLPSLRSCPLPIIPLCLSREEGMIHFFVGSHVKKPESGLFSDWIGNNTDDLRCSDWPKCRHPLVVVDFSLHFCLRNEQ